MNAMVQINSSEGFCEIFSCGGETKISWCFRHLQLKYLAEVHSHYMNNCTVKCFFLSASRLFSCHATHHVWCLPLHVSACCSPTLSLLTEGKTRSPPNVCFWFCQVESWQLQPPPVCHVSETEFMTLMSRSLILLNVTCIIYSDLSVSTLELVTVADIFKIKQWPHQQTFENKITSIWS